MSEENQKPEEKPVETTADQASEIAAILGEGAPEPVTVRRLKRGQKSVTFAKVFVQCSFNNTHVSITDDRGNVLCWAAAGGCGFKGTKKGTPFAAQVTAAKAGRRAAEMGVKQVSVFVNGPGPGRETAIRALQGCGLHVISLKDVSPIPHNGCRPPKARRV